MRRFAFLEMMLLAASMPIAHAADQPLTFVDAHSHLLPNLSIDEEMAMFKRAGVTSVVIMSVPARTEEELARNHRGYVIPFVSFARSRTSTLAPLNDDTIAAFDKKLESGAVCGFGEVGTMMQESPATSLMNPMYLKVYELAAKYRAPLTYHIELDSPEVVATFGRVADLYPRMPLILAHAGFNAGPDVAETLIKGHPNIYIELSIRLDPLNGFAEGGAAGSQGSRTTLDASGALKPEWRRLLESYPERFLFGMDIAPTGPKGRELRAVELADIARKAFSVLPRKSQEAIAHGNFEELVQNCPVGPASARK